MDEARARARGGTGLGLAICQSIVQAHGGMLHVESELGRGIVATPNDFGLNGQRPTHPELLDWLSATFVAGGNGATGQWGSGITRYGCGWSLKKLHRLLVLSATYRQSSGASSPPKVGGPGERSLNT